MCRTWFAFACDVCVIYMHVASRSRPTTMSWVQDEQCGTKIAPPFLMYRLKSTSSVQPQNWHPKFFRFKLYVPRSTSEPPPNKWTAVCDQLMINVPSLVMLTHLVFQSRSQVSPSCCEYLGCVRHRTCRGRPRHANVDDSGHKAEQRVSLDLHH